MSRNSLRVVVLAAAFLCAAQVTHAAEINAGSKRFTESYILGEILTQRMSAATGVSVAHKQGLGNTAIVFAALKSGAVDVYPEYTGTLAFELLGLKRVPDLQELNAALAVHGVTAGAPLGFGNSYALAMPAARAATLGISKISDLARHSGLRYGLTPEFLNRKDGWPGLRAAYRLSADASGLDHGLAFEALRTGSVDVIDVYTTDAQIGRQGLLVLADDQRYFPPYEALLLYRSDFPARQPAAFRALHTLTQRISTDAMMRMNAAAELDKQPFDRVAANFLAGGNTPSDVQERAGLWQRLTAPDFWRLTVEHGALVLGALMLSVAAGVPLGVWAARSAPARPWVLGLVGILQTIPALALLAFLIALLGRIGTVPAVIALFLYGLLPIVRNTESGLAGVSTGLKQAGTALGLRKPEVTWLIELPLAAPSIFAGIKTSAVINVGTATLAAFVGAGGYGERIVSGLALNDHALMLAGALPAAGLALAIQWMFDVMQRKVV